MQPLLQALLVRQDRGPLLDRLTAPQPQSTMTQGHLKRAGIQDVDLVKTQVQMTKVHQVPFSHGFFANNATQACPHGLKRLSSRLICRKESTAKQEQHQLDSYSKQEPDVKSLWHDSRMMASHVRFAVPFATPRARFLFVHLDHHNGERSVDGLHRSGKFVATQLREIFPEHDIEGTDIVPAIDFRAQFINMFDRRCGSEDTNRCLA